VNERVNLADKLALVHDYWSPRVIGELNDYKLEVVKVKGEFAWHSHDQTDEFFMVISGRLTIQLRGENVELDPGEVFVVPRGIEHCPKADSETHLLLIEPMGTVNTGDAGGPLTAPEKRI
jgi:mannose-6-phosphate isomerase-like protein (cupin superfamily)